MQHDDLKSQTLYSGSAANAPQSPATTLAEHIIGNKTTTTLPSRLLTTPPTCKHHCRVPTQTPQPSPAKKISR
jgi:hypothetical protein